RYRELGDGDLELLGGSPDGPLARGHGARRDRACGRRCDHACGQASGSAIGDFSFVVIGDTGEGDASQHALRDQLLTVAGQEDVRFVVISSDVVYPNGSMIDYETNFCLPFKGVTKPVYAIPGNHDWYDAIEAFNVTLLGPD